MADKHSEHLGRAPDQPPEGGPRPGDPAPTAPPRDIGEQDADSPAAIPIYTPSGVDGS